ncbi:MAG: glycosyltransferase family 1 protein [Candidatus Moranbacteria bacterium]|nr:glycosyltransferase family 1 protein [Candidatus Moranbacteria bacterium]
MKIAIDASRAFLDNRTGIEEYAFELVNNLREELSRKEVVLYLRPGGKKKLESSMKLPDKWEAREIDFKYFWTQAGMAWEFLTNPPDVLFIPAHTVPWIHPKNTVVTVHGLEYEHCPESYSLYSRLFHRFFIKKSCLWAKKIIAVSANTKKDLAEQYGVLPKKIKVVYNGFNSPAGEASEGKKKRGGSLENPAEKKPYFLYIGRLEKRKNIEGIIKAFEIAKEELNYKGKLILGGKPGHGYEEIKKAIAGSRFKQDILEPGYIDQDRKWQLLKNADTFLFPSFCEGFGIPILEAQSFSTPVITSNLGPMDEVAADKNILVDPRDPKEMAGLAVKLVRDEKFRKRTVDAGLENVKKYSWRKCAEETAELVRKSGC